MNIHKSSIIFGINLDDSYLKLAGDVLQCRFSSLLLNYLGLPIDVLTHVLEHVHQLSHDSKRNLHLGREMLSMGDNPNKFLSH